MIQSDNLTVKSCTFGKKSISVKGDYKEGSNIRGLRLTDDEKPHPDLLEERKRLGAIVAKIIELDEPTQERCYVDKISVNHKTGEYNITLSLRIPEIQPNPTIDVKKFNDVTRGDTEVLLNEAAEYICGEKRAQSAMEFV